jgi:hypothetical protein
MEAGPICWQLIGFVEPDKLRMMPLLKNAAPKFHAGDLLSLYKTGRREDGILRYVT